MLGTLTRGSRMEGADKSTELWQHSSQVILVNTSLEIVAVDAFNFNLFL